MAKARLYGMAANKNPKEWRGLRDPKKYRPRPREIKTTGPVAGRAVKEKEDGIL